MSVVTSVTAAPENAVREAVWMLMNPAYSASRRA
jgi:hypothetical protein